MSSLLAKITNLPKRSVTSPKAPAPVAARMAGIAAFEVMELLARAHELEAAGRDIVHMEIGEPDFPCAPPIVEAAKAALDAGYTRYTATAGISPLRQAIAGFYRGQYSLDVPVENILVTPGASGALQLATGVLVNPGQKVLMTDPGYPCNRNFVRAAGGEAVNIPVGADTNYQLTPALVEQYWQPDTVAVLLASPSNPTGTLVPEQDLLAIRDIAHARGARVIVDEIYHALVYEGQTTSALALAGDFLVINSFSKYHGMTGFRLGWLVAPEPYRREAEKLAQNLFLAPPTISQHAALAALSVEAKAIFEQRGVEFAQRRNYLLPALRELGFGIPINPQGAFYIYADCSRFTDNSHQFSWDLLENSGVAITPGADFGTHQANQHVRFAYTNSIERLEEGVRRLRAALVS